MSGTASGVIDKERKRRRAFAFWGIVDIAFAFGSIGTQVLGGDPVPGLLAWSAASIARIRASLMRREMP